MTNLTVGTVLVVMVVVNTIRDMERGMVRKDMVKRRRRMIRAVCRRLVRVHRP